MGETEHTLTTGAVRGVARAVRFAARFSRETINRMTAPGPLPPDTPATVAWPVVVTDEPPGNSGDCSELSELCPGTVYYPNPAGDPVWLSADCWIRPLPAHTFEVGDTGMGRLVGFRESGCDQPAGPIYALAGGTNSDSAGGGTSACGWVAGLTDDDCLKLTVVSVSGACSDIDPSQVVRLKWDNGDERWESTSNFVYDGGTGAVNFIRTPPVPTLTIGGVGGFYLGCDGGGLLYAFGGAILCNSSPTTCANDFVVRLTCATLAGWGGPGWYCVRAAGSDSDSPCAPVELLDGDQCNTSIVICSGPYASEAAANAVCSSPPVSVPCCADVSVPAVISLTIGGTVGAGTYPLTYNASGLKGAGWYTANITVGLNTGYYRWYCSGTTWTLEQWSSDGGSWGNSGASSATCSPLTASGFGAFAGTISDLGPTFTVSA